MREIFFDEKLGETQRNSEGVRAAWAEMGCEPHGQGWELWKGWERWEWWMGGVGVARIAPDSLTRQLPTTPKRTSWKMETEGGRVENKK